MTNGIYLAYPIDQAKINTADSDFTFDDVEKFKQMCVFEFGASWVFDPGDAFLANPDAPTRGVMRINRAALNAADAVVAFLPAGVPSIGVPMEIDRAVAAGKTVIVYSDVQSFALDYPSSNVTRYANFHSVSLQLGAEIAATRFTAEQKGVIEDLPITVTAPEFVPTRAHDDDAGLDLYVAESMTIESGAFADVPCGTSVELPYWSWAMLTGRSSTLRTKGLMVHPGIIDAGYRGPLFAGVFNLSDQPVTVEKGERLAQLIVITNMTRHMRPAVVQALSPSERGTKGFGSSGR